MDDLDDDDDGDVDAWDDDDYDEFIEREFGDASSSSVASLDRKWFITAIVLLVVLTLPLVLAALS